MVSEIIAMSPMSAPKTPAPATMPGCGGTATWMAEHDAGHGKAELDGVELGDLGEGVDDRHQHDDAHFEEHRNRDEEADGGECDGDSLGAELRGEVVGERLHAAGHFDHAAQDGAEGDQQCDLAHGAAHAVGHDGEDVRRGDLGGDGHQDADRQQCHEGLDLEADDHHQQERDARDGDGQQQRGPSSTAGLMAGASAARTAKELMRGFIGGCLL